jgi:hypothetical protein
MPTCPKGHTSVATDYCDECGSAIGGVQVAAPPVAEAPTPSGSGDACPKCGTARAGRFCEVCGHDFVLGDPAPDTADLPGTAAPPGDATLPEPATTPPPAEATGGADGVPANPVVADPGESGVPPVIAVGDAGALAAELPRRSGAVAGWRVVAAADREYYARMQAAAGPDAQQLQFPAFCPERRFALRTAQILVGRRRPSRGIEPDIDLTGPPEDAAVSHAHALLVGGADGVWSVVDLDSANGTYLNDSPDAIEPHVPVPLKDGDRIHVGAWTTLTVQHEEAG